MSINLYLLGPLMLDGLFSILMVDLLSQYRVIPLTISSLRFSTIPLIHNAALIPRSMALNSASAVDLDTTSYFLHLQVTRFHQ